MEDRITRLEERLAYQDKTIAELDEVVQDFAGRVARLERVIRDLKKSLEQGNEPMEPHDTQPPHY